MNTRLCRNLQSALLATAMSIVGSFAAPAVAAAQAEPDAAAEALKTAADPGIVVIGPPAWKMTQSDRPVVTALMPLFAPETQEQRLERVAYFLRAASVGRCANPEMLTGFSLHDTAAYDADQRTLVEGAYHFGRGIGVRHVVPQSAAARAGFRAGDVITRVNSQDISLFQTGLIKSSANYARTERFEDFLNAALTDAPAQIAIRRGPRTVVLTLPGQPGCGGKPVLYRKGGLNAWSDGKYIALTNTMMRFAADDSELAFVVAHEMAHNMLDHARKLRGKLMLLASLGIGSRQVKNSEIEADQLGAEILVTAGFPLEGAFSLLSRAGDKMPIYIAITHPGIKRRIAIVTEAAAKFEQAAVAAREERKEASLATGLTDLAFIARSLRIPQQGPGWPSLPALSEWGEGKLAGGSAPNPNDTAVGRIKLLEASQPVASVIFTPAQEKALAQAYGRQRRKAG